ncbi:MAG: hypothetical protein A7315_06190 [Candidatus Altiarchaeales archaeon WOR_SM1_79]|nr:MAG: hypothetical protein A7315_06190 [Candidatus Altiarchaeales archaeon WOR_SM1_79]
MKFVLIGIFGDNNIGKELAKKGTESDITLYNIKKDEKVISFVEPSRYPEKIQPLSYTLNMIDHAVLKISKIDKTLAETIVALDAFGIEKGCIIFEDYVTKEQITPYISGTVLENYEIIENDMIKLRERIFEIETEQKEGAVKIPIDHHFNVRGIGTVILGTVKRGTVKKHDELIIYPINKKILVRSIQIHDKDYDEGETGARIGLALKNIDAEELDRGFVLAPEGTLKTGNELKLKFKVSKYWKDPLSVEQVHHIGIGMQFFPARISNVENDVNGELKCGETGVVTFKIEKKVVFEEGDKAIVLKPEGSGLRVAGCGIVL